MAETSSKPPFNRTNSPSLTVVQAVADADGVDPLDLPQPLGEVIDTDALDSLVQERGFNGKITFSYLGYQVTVKSTGQVAILEEIP